MANVTATDAFFDDPRFDTAGVLLGIDGDLVRLKMQRLWSWQTDRYTPEAPSYVVGRAQIVGIFRLASAPEALVESGLAEERNGGYYIRGTEGVIEWLWKKRVAGRKGREAQVKSGAARAHPGHTPGTTQGADRVLTGPCDPGSVIRNPDAPTEHRERESPDEPATTNPARRPRRMATPAPADNPEPSDADRAFAAARGVSLESEWPAMWDYHRARGKASADWSASWRTWVTNAVRFAAARGNGGNGSNGGPASRPLTGLAATAEILAERAASARPYVDPFKTRG